MKKFTVTYYSDAGIVSEDVEADKFEIIESDRNVVIFKRGHFQETIAAFSDFVKVELKGE